MTEFLTPNGLKVLRLVDIKAELETAFRDAFGATTVLTPDTVLGNLIGIFAEREASLWELMDSVYNASYPGTASGVSLNWIAEITNVARNEALPSTVTLYLAAETATDLALEAGQLVAVQNTGRQFRTTAAVTLGTVPSKSIIDLDRVEGVATATTSAPHGLLAGAWVFIDGADQEEFNGLVQVANPTASAFDYTILPTGTTPASATGTIKALIPATVVAQSVEFGPIQGLSGTITEIATPVPGWTHAANTEDADLGRFEETDAELRARRIAALAGLGAAHLEAIRGSLLALPNVLQAKVFENDTDETDPITLRPPHSIEALVVDDDTPESTARILQCLFDNKAAGITTFGGVSGNVVDSQGNLHAIRFSRPDDVDIHVVLTITKNPLTFPADGALRIQDLVSAWGNSLEVGQTVVVYPYLVSSFMSVPGIVDVSVWIGTDEPPAIPTPPDPPLVQDDNIPIGQTEVADFSSDRIFVNVLP